MKFTSVLLSAAAATCALFASGVAAQDKPLPWDGRGQDLTAATLDSKYMLHIFKQRQNAAKQDPALWVTVNQKGRSPAYNSDTGVISIAVDNDAIFGGQTNFRRSELVQNVAGNTAGKTFFRASVKKDEAWVNAHSWQVIFPESHLFEVRIDATTTPPKIIFYTGGSLDVKWEAEFKLKTWYNLGIAVGSGAIELYTSTGNSQLALTKSVPYTGAVPSNYEFHYGMLTLSNDGSAPAMVAGKRDILDYNGVSVEKTVTAGGSAAASPAASDAASDADDTADEETPVPSTTAPKTTAPSTTTPKTTAPATTAPSASGADDSTAASGDDEYATPAPAAASGDDEYATPAPAAASGDDEYATPAPAAASGDDEYATPTATTAAPAAGATTPTVSPSTSSGKTPKPKKTKKTKTPKPAKTPKPKKTKKSKTPKPASATKTSCKTKKST